jgi:hypothetical protein
MERSIYTIIIHHNLKHLPPNRKNLVVFYLVGNASMLMKYRTN